MAQIAENHEKSTQSSFSTSVACKRSWDLPQLAPKTSIEHVRKFNA